tara:strand:+ start:255 stop:659 length:405 start_codon:yes stop_codon:yes gene_type:complete
MSTQIIEINTIPNAQSLNVSKVVITLNSATMFGMQFLVNGFGKFNDPEGNETWSPNPLVNTLLNISGDSWNNWGADVDDSTYIGDLALAQLGLTRDPDAVVEVEEIAPEAPEEVPVEEAPKPAKKAAKKKTASE